MNNRSELKKRAVLAVYCRHPETKHVKTRLAKGVGPEEARLFYSGCLESLRHDLGILRRQFDIAICPSDDRDVEWAESYFTDCDHIIPQIYGDLGLRLKHTDLILRGQGYERVILIGSDAPSLPLEYLEDVDNLLSRVDMVLGPCLDGGVYAIGSRITLLPMKDIPWGTGSVYSGLFEKYKREEIKLKTSSIWYDVDRVEDLLMVRRDLMRSSYEHRKELGKLVEKILSSVPSNDREPVWPSPIHEKRSFTNKNGGES